MKKFFIIIVLFALPLVAYLFFASGVNNFARLPVLSQEIQFPNNFSTYEGEQFQFDNHITILGFPGENPLNYLTNAYHLAEKIYDPYAEFHDLYFVSVVPHGSEEEVEKLKEQLSGFMDLHKWKFITATPKEIKTLFSSLGTNFTLNSDLSSPHVFIVDKDAKLRGRKDDEDVGKMYGYDTRSIAVMNNKMNDDVKVILAEYRLELKKYNNRK